MRATEQDMYAILRFVRDERGATAIEYALIGVIVSVALITGGRTIGQNMNSMFYDKALAGFS